MFGIAILVAVFARNGGYASARTFLDGFGPAIGVAALLSLAGAAIALGMPRRAAAVATEVATAVPPQPVPVPVLQANEGR